MPRSSSLSRTCHSERSMPIREANQYAQSKNPLHRCDSDGLTWNSGHRPGTVQTQILRFPQIDSPNKRVDMAARLKAVPFPEFWKLKAESFLRGPADGSLRLLGQALESAPIS